MNTHLREERRLARGPLWYFWMFARMARHPARMVTDLYWFLEGRWRFSEGWAPGHYYSPIPSLDEVNRRDAEIFAVPDALPAIDLNEQGQLATLDALARLYPDQPYGSDPADVRYTADNPNFAIPEAIILHCMIRHARPRRIIEVGCGHSSMVILDTVEHFLDYPVECTMIEPFPELLRSLLHRGDERRVGIIPRSLQEIGSDIFAQLVAGDILFIDSTHVCKTDSDVNHALHRILPALAPGVLVHFHDIYYPFEYPRPWVYQGRAWNEAYALRAFLEFNAAFRIEFFTSWLWHRHRAALGEAMPLCVEGQGSSIWLRRS